MRTLTIVCLAAAIVGGLYAVGAMPQAALAGAIGLLAGLVIGLPVRLVLSTPTPTVHERIVYRIAETIEPEAANVQPAVWRPQIEVQP